MRIDISCPVELWHFRMPTREYPVVTLQLFNLSEKTVNSVQAAFLCYDAAGERLSRQVERVTGLTGDKRSAFEMVVAVEDGERAARMDFIIERVWFDDGTVWRRGAGEMAQYDDNRLPKGKQLDALRYVAGDDAQGYPSDQGAVWVCVCGRPNPASLDRCARCARDKRETLIKYNKASIEKLIYERDSALEEKARHAREEAGRMQMTREREELTKKKRRRRATLGLVSLMLLAGAAYGVYFHGIPAWQYYRAGEFVKQREYAQAKDIYLSLEDYGDSARLAKQSDYLRAGDMAATATLTSYKAAQAIYEELGGYEDSAVKASQMVYEQAELLRLSGDYEQAIALFGQIPGFGLADDQAILTRYEWAAHLMNGLDYASAREKFLSLGDYRDAPKLSEDCLYLPALEHLEKNEFAQAETLLLQMADQEAIALKLQETHYRWGDQLFAQALYEQAAEMYLRAGDYLDSSRKAANCLYEPAKQLMADGEYGKAREIFLKIPAFQDAASLAENCAYQLGLQAMQAGEYEKAIPLFQAAPSVEGALKAAGEAAYLQAKVFENQGELDAAVGMYDKAGDYSDAKGQARRLRYALGIEAANARDYDKALEIFAALGDYENSAEELKRARYNQAISQIEAGKYEAAIAQLNGLSDYASGASYLHQAHYLLAQQRFQAGEYAAAAQGFEQAGDYQDARDLYRESVYLQAKALLGAADPAAATVLLKSIEGYKDATELLQGTAYQLAGEMKEKGLYREAAEQFALISGYRDAAAQAEACYDLYYAAAYETAIKAVKAKDYLTAIEALEPLDRENPGEKYKQVQAIYRDAVYQYANQLYDKGEPYLALPYYRRIMDYRDVAAKKLTRVAYRVLGTWQTEKGFTMVFYDDGTCTIDGRKYFFFARNYLLTVGDRKEEMNIKFNILHTTDKQLNLRREKPNTVYKMTRMTTP